MSRVTFGMVLLFAAFAARPAVACPGMLGMGLSLVFGSDLPITTSSSASPRNAESIIDFESGEFEESQEHRLPPDRTEQAKECMKAWRQLIADGRFDLAPVIAAKAASLDPNNREAQRAVLVSHALRGVGRASSCCAETAHNDTPKCTVPKSDSELVVESTLKHLFPAGLLATCGTGKSVAAVPVSSSCACKAKAKAPRSLCCTGCDADAPLITVAHQTIATTKRITIKTAAWQVECDRVATMSDREMILEGNVTMTMRGRDVTVQAARVQMNLMDGTVAIDGK